MAVKKQTPAKKEPPKKTPPKKESADTGKSWYQEGDEGFQRKHSDDAFMSMQKERNVPRFRLKPGEEATIVFVDTKGFFVSEHNLEIRGRYGNFVTCTQDFAPPCPICEATGKNPVYTAYFTIIDTREFENQKTGKKSKNRRILFPAKGPAIKVLEELRKKKGGDLTGLAVKVKRLTMEDPNCGRDFDAVGRIDIAKKLGAEAAKVHKYKDIFKPMSKAELKQMGFGSGGGEDSPGAEESSSEGASLDDLLK